MGAWGADVIHDVKQEISAIRWTIDSLRSRGDLDVVALNDIAEIDAAAARMRVPDILSAERSLDSVGEFINTPVLDEVILNEARLLNQQTVCASKTK